MKDLALVMPVYNEEEAIETVLQKWNEELEKYGIEYNIFAYNDGSKDNTAEKLEEIKNKYPNLIVINKENSGHGPTILRAYNDCCKEYNWIFQIDSDDEMGTSGFEQLWNKRDEYEFLMGYRNNRTQNITRKLISMVSRLSIKLLYGTKGPYDVNSPYRLMKSECFRKLFETIPSDTFAPNVIISGFVANKKLKFYETPVEYTVRQTGEVSIQKMKLLKAAIKSFVQTFNFAFKVRGV